MTTEHTPGPWTYDKEAEDVYSPGHGRGIPVCIVGKDNGANARLIAAAPELLEALMESHGAICAVLCAMRRDMPNHSWIPALNKAEEQAIAAIAKITNEPVMAA
jgi:hypothetical protein